MQLPGDLVRPTVRKAVGPRAELPLVKGGRAARPALDGLNAATSARAAVGRSVPSRPRWSIQEVRGPAARSWRTAARRQGLRRRPALRAARDGRSGCHLRTPGPRPHQERLDERVGKDRCDGSVEDRLTAPIAARSSPADCSAHARIRRTSPRMPTRSASQARRWPACERPERHRGTVLESGPGRLPASWLRWTAPRFEPGPLHLLQPAMPLARVEHGGTLHGPQCGHVTRLEARIRRTAAPRLASRYASTGSARMSAP